MPRIEFIQLKPRIDDWRVKVDGCTLGNVLKCCELFRVSAAKMETVFQLGSDIQGGDVGSPDIAFLN